MKNFAGWVCRGSLCGILLVVFAASAATATLQGTIIYKAPGMSRPGPLSAVLVSIYNPSTRQKIVTRTNDLGQYFFKNITSGLYVIFVEKDGRRVYQGKVDAREPQTRFDIQL